MGKDTEPRTNLLQESCLQARMTRFCTELGDSEPEIQATAEIVTSAKDGFSNTQALSQKKHSRGKEESSQLHGLNVTSSASS